MQEWNQMGVRERLFAAYKALIRGQSIQYAIDRASYNPRTDRISFGQHNDLSISVKVSQEGSKSIQDIRKFFPNLFSSDQAVLNAVAINDEAQCELGCGQEPHPGRACK